MEAVIARGSGLAIRQTGGYKLAMARPLRWQFAGAVYHVTSRGSARQKILSMTPPASYFLSPRARCISLRFDIIGVFLHGGVAETGSRRRPQAGKVFSDIDSESWNEDHGEVK
jgi:hypothetical protein